jgi:hypothetical protein
VIRYEERWSGELTEPCPFNLAINDRLGVPKARHGTRKEKPDVCSNEYWAGKWQGTLTEPIPFQLATEVRLGYPPEKQAR